MGKGIKFHLKNGNTILGEDYIEIPAEFSYPIKLIPPKKGSKDWGVELLPRKK